MSTIALASLLRNLSARPRLRKGQEHLAIRIESELRHRAARALRTARAQ